jgi:hypothetical protein
MSSVVRPKSFSVSNVTFSQLKLLESGGKQAYVNYDGRPLLMQVGSLETPFGLSVFDKTNPPKYSVDLKLQGYDDPTNNATNAQIYDAMHALDEFMIQQGVKNGKAWFKTEVNVDMVRMLYTPTVRFAKDAEGNVKPYPPTLKVQLRQRDGVFEAKVYDDRKNVLDVPLEDILVKKAFLTVLIQCTGVWFAGGKFGLSWKAVQIRADKVPDSIRGFAFLDDDEDAPQPSALTRAPSVAARAQPTPVKTSNQFQLLDDDEEIDDEEAMAKPVARATAPVDDEEEEEAEDVAPAPVPVKKTVTKKVVVKQAAKKV